MSVRGYIEKEPSETFMAGIDFAPWLETGETISTATVTARNKATGADTTSTLLSGTAVIAGTKVTRRVVAGGDGEVHILTVRATTSLTNTYESELAIEVREL